MQSDSIIIVAELISELGSGSAGLGNAQSHPATARAFKRARLANPIKIVRDGEAGLDYLFGTGRYSRRKQVRPQLIMLVLDLPRMSGSEFMRRVKADERTRDIPVVVLTVSNRWRH